jgi:hypothetical protein
MPIVAVVKKIVIRCGFGRCRVFALQLVDLFRLFGFVSLHRISDAGLGLERGDGHLPKGGAARRRTWQQNFLKRSAALRAIDRAFVEIVKSSGALQTTTFYAEFGFAQWNVPWPRSQ